jgi:hypothetical protein
MSTQFAVDLLDATIEVLRPQLDHKFPIKQRIRIFWATARAARNYSASDVVQSEFMQLARETGLISDLGRHGEEVARHVLNWAMRSLNPFEHGPLR